MIDINKGRYWSQGWQLIDGCTPCSPGCDHCWSAAKTHRFIREGESGHSNGVLTNTEGKFDGTVIIRPERLNAPLKRKKPTVYAVWNDLYHPDVPLDFIRQVYFQMNLNYQHTYLILTKRAERMAEVLNLNPGRLERAKIWHGLTVCNQQEADEKIPVFLKVPGKKFLSIEPCLSGINIEMALKEFQPLNPDLSRKPSPVCAVILGGETLGSRPGRKMKIEWAESIVSQCEAAGVPLFVKQLHLNGKVSKDMNEWPEHLRKRELPWIKAGEP